MRKISLLVGGLTIVVSFSTAAALPAFPVNPTSPPSLQLLAACPPGTHAGYLGRHCWPDRGSSCPPGYHRGYLGRHCWHNR